jgi:hypothetical protein
MKRGVTYESDTYGYKRRELNNVLVRFKDSIYQFSRPVSASLNRFLTDTANASEYLLQSVDRFQSRPFTIVDILS